MPGEIQKKFLTAFIILCSLPVIPYAFADTNLKVDDELVIAIEYTLILADGSVADTNVGGEPLAYLHGRHEILPALEVALTGMQAEQRKTVKIKAADAYGVYNQTAIMEIPRDQIPKNAKAGSILSTMEGQPARVLELTEKIAKIDFNHPLAGQDLTFDVKIISVTPKQPSVR